MSPIIIAPPIVTPTISPRTGFYSYLQGGTTSAVAQGVAGLNVSPFQLYTPLTITRLGAEITIVAGAGDAGATMVLAIYADNGAFCPGVLLFDSTVGGTPTTLDLRSATVQEMTVSVTLGPGIYWAGGVCQNAAHDATAFGTAPTLRCAPGDFHFSGPISTTLPGANGGWNGYGYRQLSVVGTLPNPFVPNASMPNGALPRIIYKAA